jgi:hypothetical protein
MASFRVYSNFGPVEGALAFVDARLDAPPDSQPSVENAPQDALGVIPHGVGADALLGRVASFHHTSSKPKSR